MVLLREKMTVGPKGQVVIPSSFRKMLNLAPGDEVIFEQHETGILMEKPRLDIVRIAEACAKKYGTEKPFDANKSHYDQIAKRLKRAGTT